MKNLNNYIEQKQTDLFNKLWIFFAFGQKQFDEQKKEWVEYVWMDWWLVIPKENVDKFLDEHTKIVEEWIKQDIQENWIENIIERELLNHEAYYTGDIRDTVDVLSDYNVSYEQVKKVYQDTYEKNSN